MTLDLDNLLEQYGERLKAGDVPPAHEFSDIGLSPGGWDIGASRYFGDIDFGVKRYTMRAEFLKRYGFAILCKEAVEALRPHAPWLEVGAGTGHWALGLKASGIDVVATDSMEPQWQFPHGSMFDVMRLSSAAAAKHFPDRNLLCVWPNYGGSWAHESVEVLPVGRVLALVSEGPGGCVGDDSLFDLLERDFEELETIGIPCWPSIHDRLTIHKRVK